MTPTSFWQHHVVDQKYGPMEPSHVPLGRPPVDQREWGRKPWRDEPGKVILSAVSQNVRDQGLRISRNEAYLAYAAMTER